MSIRRLVSRIFGFDREIENLKCKCRKLLWDSNFGIHTRAGLDEFIEGSDKEKFKTVVFIDFDGIHKLNFIYGYENVNHRIKATLCPLTGKDDVFVARWYSGDEIVVLFVNSKESTEEVMREVSTIGLNNGVPFTFMAETWDSENVSLPDLIGSLGREVQNFKASRVV